MKTVDLKSSKLSLPKIGFGTWQIEGNQAMKSVSEALQAGYRLIDTAQVYKNEEYVGAGLKVSGIEREKIFLVSKVWMDNLSQEDVVSSTQDSLDKLQTDYIDLMLIHWPNKKFDLSQTLAGFQELVQQKLIKHFGVSNFPTHWLDKILDLAPQFVCDQVEYHPFINQDPILRWLEKRDKFLMAYSPLARGSVFKNDVLLDLSKKYGKSAAQITLNWMYSQERVVAIPKANDPNHMRENLAATSFEMDKADYEKISDLKNQHKRIINPDFAPQWDQP